MRRVAALAASAIAAASAAGVARATLAPAPSLRPVRLVTTPHGTRVIESCNAHGKQLKGTAATLARKIVPVACEQPPRSNVLDGNFVLTP